MLTQAELRNLSGGGGQAAISRAASAVDARPVKGAGRAAGRYSLADSARILISRWLVEAGCVRRAEDAVAAALVVSDDVLREIIATDEPRWLVCRADAVPQVVDAAGLSEVLADGRRPVALLNIASLLRCIFEAAAQKEQET